MNKSKIKIINTPVRFYPYMGGVEHSTFHLCRELIKIGCEIKIICAKTSNDEPNQINGITIKRLKSFFKITNTNITLTLPLEILKSKFDVIHTHMPTPWCADISILLGKLMGKKTIITIHNDMDKAGFLNKIVTEIYLHSIFLLSLSIVDKIIIINPEWEKSFSNTSSLLKRHKKKISTSANGVNTNSFKPQNIAKKKNTILFVSVLDKSHKFKGLEYLLASLKIVLRRYPNANLWVIGDGELRYFYENKVKELNLEKNVKFFGEIPQSSLSEYYSQASLFVMPSINIEGFGNVLVEALACKTPVITTSIAGIAKDIIDYECGLVVRAKNSVDLAQAIVKLLENPTLGKSMGENGLKLVKNKYNWLKIARQNKNIYEELVNR